MVDLNGMKIVQQTIELKRAARFKNPVLELPDLVAKKESYANGKKAVVFEKEENGKHYLIFEFDGDA